MTTKKTTVRVLVDQRIDGHHCQCGEVIQHESTSLAPLIKAGALDGSKPGIEYALANGYEVRDLSAKQKEAS